jgi:hypothetical protein
VPRSEHGVWHIKGKPNRQGDRRGHQP